MKKIFKNDGLTLFYFYTLKLQGQKYYVGATQYLVRRLKRQLTGKGSYFSKRHGPVIAFCVEKKLFKDFSEALEYESQLTLLLINKHGVESVSGGIFWGSIRQKMKCLRTIEEQQRLQNKEEKSAPHEIIGAE